MFRGLAFSQYFTPFYSLINKEAQGKDKSGKGIEWGEKTWEDHLEDDLINIRNDPKLKEGRREFLLWLTGKIKNRIKNWDIKIKLTKSGLAIVVFKRKISGSILNTDRDYKRIVPQLTSSPITDYIETDRDPETQKILGIDRLERWEQIFTSYLYSVSIWVISMFLKDRETYKNVGKILDTTAKPARLALKLPWGVKYTAEDSFTFHTPPLRNYFFVYYFDLIQGEIWGSEKKVTLDCNLDFNAFNEDYDYMSKDEFLENFSNNFLSLISA